MYSEVAVREDVLDECALLYARALQSSTRQERARLLRAMGDTALFVSGFFSESLRDGLRSLQLAFREASPFPDEIGKGPGEKYTGPVN